MDDQQRDGIVMGVPRGRIDWSPRINWELCFHCMECATFCKHGVFTQESSRLVIQNPENCVVFCRACANTCSVSAISFPDKAKTTATIKQIRKEAATG